MSITKMNILDIMAESVRTSVVNTDNQTIDKIAEAVADQVYSLDEMDIDLTFTPEMVPVVFDEATGRYFVEYDMLAKLHEGCDDCIELETKYGKIKFEPREEDDDDDKEEECKMDKPGDESITEEDPEEPEEPELDDDEEDYDDKNEIDESYMNPFWTPAPSCGGCWEKDALAQVILANMERDPNREELDKKNGCEVPEMTMENTYIVIESEKELCGRINGVTEAAKSGGIALKNGKAQLKKANEVFKNMINHGLKVVKKKSTK